MSGTRYKIREQSRESDQIYYALQAFVAHAKEKARGMVEIEMAGKSAKTVDARVGQNIKFHRIQAGMTQQVLAGRLGLTFQQVQKYEKGTNRTSAGRLVQIASVMGISITALFDGVKEANGTPRPTISTLVKDAKTMELLQAFAGVDNAEMRSAIVSLVRQIASS